MITSQTRTTRHWFYSLLHSFPYLRAAPPWSRSGRPFATTESPYNPWTYIPEHGAGLDCNDGFLYWGSSTLLWRPVKGPVGVESGIDSWLLLYARSDQLPTRSTKSKKLKSSSPSSNISEVTFRSDTNMTALLTFTSLPIPFVIPVFLYVVKLLFSSLSSFSQKCRNFCCFFLKYLDTECSVGRGSDFQESLRLGPRDWTTWKRPSHERPPLWPSAGHTRKHRSW